MAIVMIALMMIITQAAQAQCESLIINTFGLIIPNPQMAVNIIKGFEWEFK